MLYGSLPMPYEYYHLVYRVHNALGGEGQFELETHLEFHAVDLTDGEHSVGKSRIHRVKRIL